MLGAAFAAARLWTRANPRAALALLGAVAVIALLLFVYLKGRSDNARAERARDVVAVQAAIKSDTRANQKAAAVVVRDAVVRVQKEKELADAVADLPDSLPDPVAVRAGCVELCQQGTSVADLPQCRLADGRTPACSPG